MAAPKKAKANENKNGRVELRIPRDSQNDDPNYFISVNGKNYLIPKGVTVYVPPEVKAEYERAADARESFFDLVNERANQE